VGAEREHRFGFEDAESDLHRRAEIRNDISERLRKACAHLSDEEFRALVEQMTERQLEGERRGRSDFAGM